MIALAFLAVFAGGYAASIFTWDKVKIFWLGASKVANDLRNQAAAIEAKIRAAL